MVSKATVLQVLVGSLLAYSLYNYISSGVAYPLSGFKAQYGARFFCTVMGLISVMHAVKGIKANLELKGGHDAEGNWETDSTWRFNAGVQLGFGLIAIQNAYNYTSTLTYLLAMTLFIGGLARFKNPSGDARVGGKIRADMIVACLIGGFQFLADFR